jgi:hypothetical protein
MNLKNKQVKKAPAVLSLLQLSYSASADPVPCSLFCFLYSRGVVSSAALLT